ncbi:hypothetical protein [Acinetobacter defluvii]|uniref:hypothetical protein n=1 Tax=Acinetobacter defluvii TaxID=1871111 RepID=UPI003AF44C1B
MDGNKKDKTRKPSKIDNDALRKDVEKYPNHYVKVLLVLVVVVLLTIGDAPKCLNIKVKKDLIHPKAKKI